MTPSLASVSTMNKSTRDERVAVLKRIARAASISGDDGLFSSVMKELSEYGVTSWQDLPSSEVVSQCIAKVESLLQSKIDAARSGHMRKEFSHLKKNVMWQLEVLTKV